MKLKKALVINIPVTMVVAAMFVLATMAVFMAGVVPAAGQGLITDTEYNVPRGEVVSVPGGNSAILVDRFTMGDGGRLEISADTELFVIRAGEAVIGNDTTILGKGRNGAHATDAGGAGDPGAPGPTIVLVAEKQNIQGLTISAVGGDGGDGTQGARGANGREASCSSRDAEAGRPGEPGGAGGDAGDGGNLFLVLPSDAGGYGILMNVNSGAPGMGGRGGRGGDGGRGRNRCGVWPYWRKGSGPGGPTGTGGSDGSQGNRGLFRTYHLEDFEPTTVITRLQEVVSLLEDSGYQGNAAALRAVLDAGVLTRR